MVRRFFFVWIAVVLLSAVDLAAASYKGQRLFSKHCVRCHGRQDFIESKTKKQWQKLMRHKGELLAQIHLESQNAKRSWRFFKSRRYKRKAKHLRDFLIEYAKDSGRVPACN